MKAHVGVDAVALERDHTFPVASRLRNQSGSFRRVRGLSALVMMAAGTVFLQGCAGNTFMGGDGPSLGRIKATTTEQNRTALLVGIDGALARNLDRTDKRTGFMNTFGEGRPYGTLIGAGDVLQVALFEAPPALLFGGGATMAQTSGGGQRGMTLSDIEVDASGRVSIPFAGTLDVQGKTPQQVALEIVARLRGKANQPQAVVTMRNVASTVTVVGQVRSSLRVPLTFKGERVLDAIAAAGGASEPVDKVSLQLTRGGQSALMPFDEVIASPGENIFLKPGDVLTVSYQPESFTVLGATGRNDEIKFEARGITLAQALGRIGGLRDDRANPGGIFIFRLEDAKVLTSALPGTDLSGLIDADGKVPVIYRADLREPVTFFAAQHFAMRDRDIVYATNAPVSDLQKFVNIIGAAVYPVVTVKAAGF